MGAFPLFEVVARRTENAKHWIMSDGSRQGLFSLGPIHYLDNSDMWQNIDISIVDPVAVAIPKQPISKTLHGSGGWAHSQHFTTPYNKADLRLPKNIKSGYVIGFGQDRLTFTPVGASPSLGQVNPVTSNEIDYQDVWVDTDITLTSFPNGVKEAVVLKSNNSPTTFSFKVDGPLASDFSSGDLQIHAPWYIDANGTRKDATMSQRTQGSQTFIDIAVDTTGLSFPITLDPTVSIQEQNGAAGVAADAQVYSYNSTTNYGTSPALAVGTALNGGVQTFRSFIRFDLSSVPSGSTISSATLTLYSDGSVGDPVGTTNFHWVTAAWTEAAITWANQPAYESTPFSSKSISSPAQYASMTFDVTSYVSRVASGQTNNGFAMESDNPNYTSNTRYTDIYSKDNTAGGYYPAISATYTTPPGAPTVTAPNGGETINTTFNIAWTAAQDNDPGTYFGYSATSTSGSTVIQNASGMPQRVAQIFTAPSTMYGVESVKLYAAGNGGAATITVDIESVSGGVPTGTKLNSTTPTINLTGSAQSSTVGFGTTVPVTPGQQYAIVITATGSASSIVYYISPSASSQFGSTYQQTYGSSTWSSAAPSGDSYLVGITPTSDPSSLTYQIDLSQDNGSTWTNIVSATAAGATSYNYDFTNTPASSTNLIRVRAYDGTAYGPYDQSNGVFTIQHDRAPTAPTNLSPSSGALDHTQPITATWQYNDPDTGDSQSKFNIKWSTNNGSTWTEVDGTVTASTSYTWAANTFTDGQTVQWMVQTYDTSGLNSPWSAQAQFVAGTVPGTPTITSPANNATVATANPTIQWSSSGQTDYQLQVQDMSSNVLWDSGDVASTNVAATITGYSLANSTSYQIALRVKNSEGLWSQWAKNTINVSYTPPAASTTTAISDKTNALITVSIVNPTPSGSQPIVDHNDLYRRNSGTNTWTRIATGLAVGSSSNPTEYVDYAVASGQGYDYKVTAIGTNGTQTDSTQISGVTVGNLGGLWLHDVTDPGGSIVNLTKYYFQSSGGATPNTEQWTPTATNMQFAGRELPVVEFGEQSQLVLSKGKVTIFTSDANWPNVKNLIQNRNVVCLRDARGRLLYGVFPAGYTLTDSLYGQQVDLSFTAVDYSPAV